MQTSRASLRTAASVAALLALVVGACTLSDDDDRADGPRFFGLRGAPVELQADRSCDAVLEDFRAYAPTVFENSFFGFATGGVALEDGVDADFGANGGFDRAATPSAAPTAEAADSQSLGATGGGDSSDTNTQEAGIDEPDRVENDGDFVYVVDQDALVILDAATAEVLSRTSLNMWDAQLLLQGDRLLVIGGGGYGYAVDDVMVGGPPVAIDDVDRADGGTVDPGGVTPPPDESPTPLPLPVEPAPFRSGTTLVLLDVSDRTAPALVETTEIEGWHVSTRVVDGVARIVVTSYPDPQPLAGVEEAVFGGRELDLDAGRAALDAGLAETTIEDWLPSYRTTTAEATSIEGSLVECEDVLIPEVNAGVSETSVLRFDFDDGFDPTATTTVVAETSTVYASASTLYLAANQYIPIVEQQEVRGQDFATAIHAFDLSGSGAAAHAGAGAIPGHVLNQYSLSEHDGYLRIATTEGSPWDEVDPSQSGVRVLEARDGALTEVGSVTGLGVTEVIQSVRFMGPVAYVVTFRQTDPLYVVDLSDPTDPVAVGELKIPGFSSYLHPVGEGRLLGVGRDADLDGRDRGFLVSLFDVSDPTDPRQLQTYTEPDAWSAAGNDPKTFLWWAPESTAIVPIERYGFVGEPRAVPVEPLQDVDGQTDGGSTSASGGGEASAGAVGPDPDAPAVEPAQPVDRPDEPVAEEYYEPDFESGILVLDVADDGITERGTVTIDGRYPSRAIVVKGRLWSIFDGGVAVSDFGDVTDAEFHSFR